MKQNLRFVLGRLADLKISLSKLNYATFEGSFFYVFVGKTNKKQSVHGSVHIKKLHNIKF